MYVRSLLAVLTLVNVAGCGPEPATPGGETASEADAAVPTAAEADAALTVPDGFRVTVFHEGIGTGARHLVVRDNGDVLVARSDGVLVALRDQDGDGSAERLEERELPISTGIALLDGTLYLSDDVSVSRLALDASLLPEGEPELVVGGFPKQGSHAAKSLALDPQGRLYVNVGAPSNACQQESRTPGSAGQQPCPQLERQAAIWRFPAGASGLDQTDGERFVSGTRNVMAMDWNGAADALYFVIHGRDQLDTLWPEQFNARENAQLPAEELHRAEQGADYGWPYTFYDPRSGRRLVAPEYGGDGEQVAPAGRYPEPLHAFPAHWAPNDLVFYLGDAFPPDYRGGAFIAWHGSWNRAPLPQEGFRVTFVPFADGAPAGEPRDFLTGFEGAESPDQSSGAEYRPTGLGVGPEGALYVSDTQKGRIWRVTYGG